MTENKKDYKSHPNCCLNCKSRKDCACQCLDTYMCNGCIHFDHGCKILEVPGYKESLLPKTKSLLGFVAQKKRKKKVE